MTARSRRSAATPAVALMAIGLALSLGAVNVEAAGSPLTITAHVGYSDVVKNQQWMPIAIAITNDGPEVDGNLEILASFGGRPGFAWPAVYERRVVLATGSTKYFRTYLAADPSMTVTIRVVKNGRVVGSQDAAGVRNASTLIGVLSDDSSALDNLAAVHPGGVSASVVHLGLADIVDSAIALRGFDLLVVDDFATDGLSTSQRGAIADYVRTGGHLLVGTGASWRRTVAGLPADILPMQVTGLTTLPSSSALSGLSDVQVATGTLSGGTAWLSEGNQPLLADRSIGSGSVTLAAFDWKQDPISGWSGTDALLRQFVVRTMFAAQGPQGSTMFIGGPVPGPFGGQGSSAYQRSSALSQVLGNLPALDLPSLALTGLLVLIYVLLVGPINYFVLGALHRRALSWITLPLIAVIVAAGAYGGGISTRGQSVQTNQLSIIHVDPGSDRAYQETYTGVLTPTRGDYQVGTGRQAVLVSPIGSFNPYGGGARADIRVNVTDGSIFLPGMTAFTLRGFATESIVAAPQLTGHLQEINGQLTGTIENRSTTTFTDAVVIAGDGYQKLGPLAPGAVASVGFAPKATTLFNGPPAVYGIYPNYSFGPPAGQPTDAQREGEAKTRILTLLSGGGFKGIPSATFVPQVVGWTNQSFETFTVNGVRPHAHAETAVAVTLPVEQVGAGTLPTGMVSGRIVDFQGSTTQQGPPGAFMVQNGTVTYSFTMPLRSGLHLTSAAISASNPYLGKAIGAPGNPVPTARGEAWDWSDSTWVEVAYQDNGTTALPDAAVNPGSGEVRLRVTVSNGSFLASGLSLTGTVQ